MTHPDHAGAFVFDPATGEHHAAGTPPAVALQQAASHNPAHEAVPEEAPAREAGAESAPDAPAAVPKKKR